MILMEGLDLAGLRVESEHGSSIKVVAGMSRPGPGCGVADAPIDGLGVLVVSAGHPGGTTTRFPVVAAPRVMARLTLARNSEGPPKFLAIVGVKRNDITPDTEFAAGPTDDNFSVHYQGHQG